MTGSHISMLTLLNLGHIVTDIPETEAGAMYRTCRFLPIVWGSRALPKWTTSPCISILPTARIDASCRSPSLLSALRHFSVGASVRNDNIRSRRALTATGYYFSTTYSTLSNLHSLPPATISHLSTQYYEPRPNSNKQTKHRRPIKP